MPCHSIKGGSLTDRVGLTENAAQSKLARLDLFIRWGVPEHVIGHLHLSQQKRCLDRAGRQVVACQENSPEPISSHAKPRATAITAQYREAKRPSGRNRPLSPLKRSTADIRPKILVTLVVSYGQGGVGTASRAMPGSVSFVFLHPPSAVNVSCERVELTFKPPLAFWSVKSCQVPTRLPGCILWQVVFDIIKGPRSAANACLCHQARRRPDAAQCGHEYRCSPPARPVP